ncbi:MAG: hypothetical protein RSD87_05210, partial [Cellulosilyticaceae bacterium]
MRRINKLTSLMLAMIMMVSFMMPGGVYEVFATGGKSSITIGRIHLPEETLQKGDSFNIIIEYNAIGIDGPEKDQIQIFTSGGVSDEGASWERTGSTIEGTGLVYNGKSSEFTIELWHPELSGPTNSVKTTQSLTVESLATAEELTIDKNTINVVAGETQQITFKLTNNTQKRVEAGQMELTIKDKNSTSKGIEIKTKKIDVPELTKGASKDFNVTLAIDENVTRGI